ncbi:hypothetical protein EMCRGX_G030850 [Ephydatia muelleri]
MATTAPALLRRSARLGKRSKSGLKESATANKKRKTRDMHNSLAPSDLTMKENCDRMQSISLGRLQPTSKENLMASTKRTLHPLPCPPPATPLPKLTWASSLELWRQMRAKDRVKSAPESDLRLRHPSIMASMRTILLDWMMEVSEEYRLHRETYYLAMDMCDRFMDTQTNLQKEQLQLIGVTCLFIASKIEEIYPPRIAEFAYVTDGACSVSDMVDMELVICKALNWKLNHVIVTVNTWVNTYMQLGSHHLRPADLKAKEFEYPAYSSLEFIRIMQLLDMCTLDITHRQFSTSVLAASALYLVMSDKTRPHLHIMTGLEINDIHTCFTWMQPFALVLNQNGPVAQKMFKGVIPQDLHNIQNHDISMPMFEDAKEMRKRQEMVQITPFLPPDCSVLMTPPRQPERRSLAPMNVSC